MIPSALGIIGLFYIKKWSRLQVPTKQASSANEACFVGHRSRLHFFDGFMQKSTMVI